MFKKTHYFLKKLILGLIDAFYPLFRKIMPHQTFRYAVCGGGNAVLNFAIFSITENLIVKKQVVHIIPNLAISSHIFSFLVAFGITFPIGFYLNTFVVFEGSYLLKRVQLFRYFTIVLICFLLNYVFMKLFVDHFGWYPTPSYILTFGLVTFFSYFSQRNFTFKKKLD
ncbi:phenylalanine 4-monooxygenase [Pedobacter psychrophilus]|uniref:Phenylalanine 4-monooxygenase n=1 Tax=Pedobacter psychrophilus TaxID=1826909 RepID=A0A179DMC9_9SPHI|nr:GtrA family protein [Pedobacter psychrophilus]OAQ42221.1 phenylalanine 4-monooxygenase [Pedobacter psychrophilus]